MVEPKKKSRWVWPYRLVLLNDISLGEVFSIRFTPLNFLFLVAGVTLFMSTLLTSVIAFTPVRELIPGYGSEEERIQLRALVLRADSLSRVVLANDSILRVMKNVLTGSVYSLQAVRPTSGLTASARDEKPPQWPNAEKLFKTIQELSKKRPVATDISTGSLMRFFFPVTADDARVKSDSSGNLTFFRSGEIQIFSPFDGMVIQAEAENKPLWIIIGKDGLMALIEGMVSASVDSGMPVKEGEFLGSGQFRVVFRFYQKGKKINPDYYF